MRDPRACVGGHSDKAIRARPISDTSHRGGSFSKSTDVSTRIPGEMEEKMREMIHQNAGLSMRIRSMGLNRLLIYPTTLTSGSRIPQEGAKRLDTSGGARLIGDDGTVSLPPP